MSRILLKILALLEHHGHKWPSGRPPNDLRIDRIYAGRHQRSAGAWSWQLWSDSAPQDVGTIGSQFPASEVARMPPEQTTLSINPHGQLILDPESKQPERLLALYSTAAGKAGEHVAMHAFLERIPGQALYKPGTTLPSGPEIQDAHDYLRAVIRLGSWYRDSKEGQ